MGRCELEGDRQTDRKMGATCSSAVLRIMIQQ